MKEAFDGVNGCQLTTSCTLDRLRSSEIPLRERIELPESFQLHAFLETLNTILQAPRLNAPKHLFTSPPSFTVDMSSKWDYTY